VSFVKRRLAEDAVLSMHPDRWWACAVGGVPLQSAAAKSSPLYSSLIFFELHRSFVLRCHTSFFFLSFLGFEDPT